MLVPLHEVRERVLAACAPLPTEVVPAPDALGRVLAVEVAASEDVPPFDNTAVDGFAVRAADLVGPSSELPVVGTVAAGAPDLPSLAPGTALRIMTGAPLPPGADAVVMVEDTTVREDGGGDGSERVVIATTAQAGDHVRRAGDDLPAGAVAVPRGTHLRPAHIGLLATVGRAEVEVHRRPRVAVVSTGDELVEGTAPLRPGQIRDSNRAMLLALCAEAGVEGVDLGLVRDDPDAISAALREGAGTCDAVVTSGGVSMGDFDWVKVVLDRIGDMSWYQVAIKPAKPFAFGTVEGVPVFGLPGNPVSSLVSFELFARPALRVLAGRTDPFRPLVRLVAGTDLRRHPDGKTHFVRVRWSPSAEVVPTGAQGSHQLSSSADAVGLAVLPDGDGVVAGETVEVLLLGPES